MRRHDRHDDDTTMAPEQGLARITDLSSGWMTNIREAAPFEIAAGCSGWSLMIQMFI
jgi:hypothetical protein